MITIPTGEFVGLLSDAIPFADTKPEFTLTRCVRLFWDGHELATQAHNQRHLGWSQWSADDPIEGDAEMELFDEWGGDDQPWSIVIDIDDAKHLVKTYKLSFKRRFTLLTLEHLGGDAVRIVRAKAVHCPAISTVVGGTGTEFANLSAVLSDHSTLGQVDEIGFNAAYLASFAKVRQRGPLVMQFTGPDKPVHVSVGSRFTGAIMPIPRQGNRRPALVPVGDDDEGGEQP